MLKIILASVTAFSFSSAAWSMDADIPGKEELSSRFQGQRVLHDIHKKYQEMNGVAHPEDQMKISNEARSISICFLDNEGRTWKIDNVKFGHNESSDIINELGDCEFTYMVSSNILISKQKEFLKSTNKTQGLFHKDGRNKLQFTFTRLPSVLPTKSELTRLLNEHKEDLEKIYTTCKQNMVTESKAMAFDVRDAQGQVWQIDEVNFGPRQSPAILNNPNLYSLGYDAPMSLDGHKGTRESIPSKQYYDARENASAITAIFINKGDGRKSSSNALTFRLTKK